MIISHYHGQLFLVTQPEHSELVGQIAAQWGNGVVDRAEPYRSMVVLAAEHDHAWSGEDNQPSFNSENNRPHDYITLPYDLHTAIYQKGTRDTALHDSYAGLLLSMHGLGIYNQRFGTDAGQVRPMRNDYERTVIEKYVNEEEHFQEQLKQHFATIEGYESFMDESHIWTNYLLMQIWDRLGLLLCKRQESSFVLEPVPMHYGSSDKAAIQFEWEGDGVFQVDPYPFSKDEMVLHFKGRLLPDCEYASQADYHDHYYGAERVPVSYRFHA